MAASVMAASTRAPSPVRSRWATAARIPTAAVRAPSGTATTTSGNGGVRPGASCDSSPEAPR